ncbi:MAG: fatty-acid synthase [Cyanobacteria bacterium 13_1_40CM_2_61_4]|nr:MAG: fatty-acid synthase [Cyanobacteria bacterium 13_1_40CM_2_61_4]
MSRRDYLHIPVRRALEKDGWTITDDPLALLFRGILLKADLGARWNFAAEKNGWKIAVEVTDFNSQSATSQLEKMMGQVQLYQWALDEQEPDRALFLAISEYVYNEFFRKRPLFQTVVERIGINLVVFDQTQEVILRWIKQ